MAEVVVYLSSTGRCRGDGLQLCGRQAGLQGVPKDRVRVITAALPVTPVGDTPNHDGHCQAAENDQDIGPLAAACCRPAALAAVEERR